MAANIGANRTLLNRIALMFEYVLAWPMIHCLLWCLTWNLRQPIKAITKDEYNFVHVRFIWQILPLGPERFIGLRLGISVLIAYSLLNQATLNALCAHQDPLRFASQLVETVNGMPARHRAKAVRMISEIPVLRVIDWNSISFNLEFARIYDLVHQTSPKDNQDHIQRFNNSQIFFQHDPQLLADVWITVMKTIGVPRQTRALTIFIEKPYLLVLIDPDESDASFDEIDALVSQHGPQAAAEIVKKFKHALTSFKMNESLLTKLKHAILQHYKRLSYKSHMLAQLSRSLQNLADDLAPTICHKTQQRHIFPLSLVTALHQQILVAHNKAAITTLSTDTEHAPTHQSSEPVTIKPASSHELKGPQQTETSVEPVLQHLTATPPLTLTSG